MINIKNDNACNILKKLALTLSVLLMSAVCSATVLVSIDVSSLPGDETELKFSFNGPAPEVTGYSIEQPPRIALDLLATSSSLENSKLSLGGDGSSSLIILEDANTGRTRAIFTLSELVAYKTRAEGSDLYVTLGGEQEVAKSSAASDKVNSILSVDFRRDESGGGQVILSLSNAAIPVDIRESGGKIYAEVLGVDVPEKLRRRLDVIDFGTPVKFIDLIPEGNKGVLVVEPEGEWEYLAYQADNVLTINVKPLTLAEVEQRTADSFLFSGEKLSLNFQDIEVRSVLQLIADFTSLNLVASDTVSGSITLRLQNVPWDQALDLILKTKGLDKRQVGNVLLVAPAAELAAREKLELESQAQVDILAPLRTEYIQINYAKAADIAALIMGENGALTSRGSATVDVRTNTLIINDTLRKIDEIRSIIEILDIPVQQVLIEARIVLASTSFNYDFGVKWGLSDSQLDSNWAISEDLQVDFAAPGPTMAIGVSDLGSGLLELELSALESDGHGEVVSSPKVLTADQVTARIAQGQQIPYSTVSLEGTQTEFVNAELSLEVTPQITPDNKIIMDLKVNKDSPGEVGPGGVAINTNQVETQVLVSNGETVVLGGIFETAVRTDVQKVPLFGDLPVIGRFFRRDTTSEEKVELLIFITPKIVSENYFVN